MLRLGVGFAFGSDHCRDQGRRSEETDNGAGEQIMETDHGQQCSGEHRAGNTFEVIGQSRQRQGPGVFVLIGQDVGNGRLKGWSERGRGRLQDENQHIDLPDLRHKRQGKGDQSTYQVQRDQHCLAWQAFCKSRSNRCNANIGCHLDRQRCAEDCTRSGSRKVEGQQPQCNGGKPRTYQRNDLSQEQMPVGSIGEYFQHGASHRGGRVITRLSSYA